jgi:hypothetical protein
MQTNQYVHLDRHKNLVYLDTRCLDLLDNMERSTSLSARHIFRTELVYVHHKN